MKRIVMERCDGRVAILHPAFGEVFGRQAGLAPAKIVELQRQLFGIPDEQVAALEDLFAKALASDRPVEIKVGKPDGVTVRTIKLPVLASQEEVLTGYAAHRLNTDFEVDAKGRPIADKPIFKRFVALIEENDLPRRETRDSWKLDGDKVVAADLKKEPSK